MSAPFCAVLAGGRSTRYGAPKALARVGGERIVDRVRAALESIGGDIVLIANDETLYEDLGLPTRPDAVADAGALGGIYTALLWAREEGRRGVLAVACDMPFLQPALLRELLERAAHSDAPQIVSPESDGRRGVEPLCAYYDVACIPPIEARLARGDLRVIGFWDGLRVARIPLAEVRRHGDPEKLFLNVNTPEERARAESLARADAHA